MQRAELLVSLWHASSLVLVFPLGVKKIIVSKSVPVHACQDDKLK